MSRPFRFSVIGSRSDASAWIATARQAEELGYSTLLSADRPPSGGLAPLTSLAYAAAATTSLHVGTSVLVNDYRHPVLLASEAASLDRFSQGRLELGLGAGNWPGDYEQLGLPFDSAGTRISRLEEALTIFKAMFSEKTVNFSGKYYTVRDVAGVKSFQQPHPSLFIGGSAKRMLQLAAREADIINIAPRMTAQGVDPGDTTPQAFAQKIAWVQEAAGERFTHLELCMLAFHLSIYDEQTRVQQDNTLTMNVNQAIEHLLELRERSGFSSFLLLDVQMENFAPVVARLAGR
ncbi:MAG TPA: TIGR03621 family F420-dependent LLM class oxidoreductase [Ktedonobacteraceae bacterium]|nr:TIGR03621 family F420-dependent LLM class oxidoreductase [Ktedonobacteraceae bacterium]